METNEIENLLCELVSIDSTNPDLVSGGAGESVIAGFVAEWLGSRGFEVHRDLSIPGRPSVIGIARGTGGGIGGGKSLLLNGHLDTVGAGGMRDPHRPEARGGKLHGRGSYDMKGGLAACMIAAAEAAGLSQPSAPGRPTRLDGCNGSGNPDRPRLRGDIIVAAVADEEFAGRGTIGVVEYLRQEGITAHGAVVAEGTDEELIIAHKGFVWLEVETAGTAAHGSRPNLGVDAIVSMGHFLVGLDRLNGRLMNGTGHPLLGPGSLHASLIVGGRELSTYPDECRLSIERRTIPGETGQDAAAELETIIRELSAAEGNRFRARVRKTLERGPLEMPPGSPLVQQFLEAAECAAGKAVPVVGAPYWTDAATLHDAGIPAVLFGPSGAGAHADEEWVDLPSVFRCAAIYAELARKFCG